MFALFSVFDFVSPDRLVFGQPWMDWFIQVGYQLTSDPTAH